MRIKHSEWPILQDVKLGDKSDFFHHMRSDIVIDFDKKKSNIKYQNILNNGDIYYITDNIMKIILDEEGFLNDHTQFYKHGLDGSGIFLFREQNRNIQIAYSVTSLIDGGVMVLLYSIQSEKFISGGFWAYVECKLDNSYKIHAAPHFFSENESLLRSTCELCTNILKVVIFKKYAPIETVVLNKNKTKKSKLNGQKHMTDSDVDVTIIDSTWFTTLIKTNSSKVRGHFRMQPCGPGRKDLKLTWVKPHERSGYIRKAKKQKEDE